MDVHVFVCVCEAPILDPQSPRAVSRLGHAGPGPFTQEWSAGHAATGRSDSAAGSQGAGLPQDTFLLLTPSLGGAWRPGAEAPVLLSVVPGVPLG